MFYFYSLKKPIVLNPEKSEHLNQFSYHFNVKESRKATFLYRERNLPNRALFRLFFPNVVVKVMRKEKHTNYKIRLDWIGNIIFFVVLSIALGEFFIDRVNSPRDWPIYLPFIYFGWYILVISIEVYKTKKIITTYQQA